MTKSRNRISTKDTIKGMLFDKNGNIISSVYDNRFHSIPHVISTLISKGAGWMKKAGYVSIKNEDKGWYGFYSPSGKIIKV